MSRAASCGQSGSVLVQELQGHAVGPAETQLHRRGIRDAVIQNTPSAGEE